jgi:uncharacterized protein (TIGR03067 family)
MAKKILFLVGIFVVLVAALVTMVVLSGPHDAAPSAGPTSTGPSELEGRWKAIRRESTRGTHDVSAEGGYLLFAGEQATMNQGDGAEHSSTFKVDASQNPKRVAFTESTGRGPITTHMIYVVNGDTLRMGMNHDGMEYPKVFIDDDTETMVFTREK